MPSSASTFTDTAFNLGDYTESLAYASDASLTFGQCATCGNTGTALSITAIAPSGVGDTAIAFINAGFSYNPSTGAIASISASVDKNFSTSFTVSDFGSAFHPTIEQDGVYYVASIAGPTLDGTTTGYATIAQTGLTAADFQQFDFATGSFVPGAPNFSGDPMFFGLTQIFGFQGDADFGAEADYDNFTLTINSVPEASTWALLALGLGAAGLAGRRSARKTVAAGA